MIFEFSPLEWAGWDDVEQLDRPRPTVLRALWVVNNGTEFLVHAFVQNFGGPGLGMRAIGPIFFIRDAKAGKVGMVNVNEQTCPDENQLMRFLVKPFFVALMLLRHLSPVRKPAAYARMAFKAGEENVYLTSVLEAAAALFRCRDPKGKRDWYAIYDPKGEPFAHEETVFAMLEVRGVAP